MSNDLEAKISPKYWIKKIINENNGEILNEKIAGVYSDNEIRFYCDGHKIDIDIGCFASKQIALLDLDTFEPIYFKLEEEPNGINK